MRISKEATELINEIMFSLYLVVDDLEDDDCESDTYEENRGVCIELLESIKEYESDGIDLEAYSKDELIKEANEQINNLKGLLNKTIE